MTGGQLISLVSCIYHRREDLIAAGKKSLGASDETLLQRAEALIENEVAFVQVLSIPFVVVCLTLAIRNLSKGYAETFRL